MGKVRFCEMSSPPEKRHTVSLLAPLARRKKLWRRGGDDDFGATTKQPRPRATRLLKRLCRLRMFYARFATNSKGFWSKHIIAIASSRARSSETTWRVLAMSKILWTKQRLVAGRTLSQLVEGWPYCVVYPYFVYRYSMILSKARVTLTMRFGKKNVQFWGGNHKIY